jgi:hypothetical protein
MYDILRRDRAHGIQHEHRFGKQTVTERGMFCRETMLVFWRAAPLNYVILTRPSRLTTASLVGENTIGVRQSISCSRLGQNHQHADDHYTRLYRNRHCGKQSLLGCAHKHRPVKHTTHFVHPDTEDHTNTIKSTWRRVKVLPGQ